MSNHDEPGHECIPLNTRTIWDYDTGDDDGTMIFVDHVYIPDGAVKCDCGAPAHDPGMVALLMTDDEHGAVSAVLEPEVALVLANRLTRAASLALESREQPPDVEREAARLAPRGVPGEVPPEWTDDGKPEAGAA